MKVSFQNKEVTSPVFAAVIVVSLITLLVVGLPVWMVLDLILQSLGYKGIFQEQPDGKIAVVMGNDAFRKDTA
jgi:hypothetical protein